MATGQKAKRVRRLKRLRIYAAQIRSQDVLDAALLPIQDTAKRREIYEEVRPMLKFSSHFPTLLTVPGQILRP